MHCLSLVSFIIADQAQKDNLERKSPIKDRAAVVMEYCHLVHVSYSKGLTLKILTVCTYVIQHNIQQFLFRPSSMYIQYTGHTYCSSR